MFSAFFVLKITSQCGHRGRCPSLPPRARAKAKCAGPEAPLPGNRHGFGARLPSCLCVLCVLCVKNLSTCLPHIETQRHRGCFRFWEYWSPGELDCFSAFQFGFLCVGNVLRGDFQGKPFSGVASLPRMEYDVGRQVTGNHLLLACETLERTLSQAVRPTLDLVFECRRKPPAWGERPRILVCNMQTRLLHPWQHF